MDSRVPARAWRWRSTARWSDWISTIRMRAPARERGIPLVISTDAHSRQRAVTSAVGRAGGAARLGRRPATCSIHVRSTSCAPGCGGIGGHDVAKTPDGFVSLKSLKQGPPVAARHARAAPTHLLQDDAADDRARLRARDRAAQKSRDGRRAREGDRLHARPVGVTEGMEHQTKKVQSRKGQRSTDQSSHLSITTFLRAVVRSTSGTLRLSTALLDPSR